MLKKNFNLTLIISPTVVASADNFANSLDPDQARQIVGPDRIQTV